MKREWSKWRSARWLWTCLPRRCPITDSLIWPWQTVYYRYCINFVGLDYEFISEKGLVVKRLQGDV